LPDLSQRVIKRLGLYGKRLQWRFIKSYRKEVTLSTRQGVLSVATQDDEIGQSLFLFNEFQRDLSQNALNFLREKSLLPAKGTGTLLDIGANNGVISIGMLTDNEFQSCIGIEPDGNNVGFLKKNVAQNNLGERYTVVHAAASDREGEVFLELSTDNFGDHQVSFDGTTQSRERQKVRAAPLDTLLSELPQEVVDKIALIWIDVQGHEGYVFAGGKKLFGSSIPIVTELSPSSIARSGMKIEDFCQQIAKYRAYFWVWRRCGTYIRYPIAELPVFCEELGMGEFFDDVILTN
jgi:FkbM family methyltransferase